MPIVSSAITNRVSPELSLNLITSDQLSSSSLYYLTAVDAINSNTRVVTSSIKLNFTPSTGTLFSNTLSSINVSTINVSCNLVISKVVSANSVNTYPQNSGNTCGITYYGSNGAVNGEVYMGNGGPVTSASVTDLVFNARQSSAYMFWAIQNSHRMYMTSGGLTILGSLSKGSGSFKINHPHPSKSNTHHLVHSFIEGPQADLIYRGKVNLVNGMALINIDNAANMTEGTFELLCRDVQCFTTNESDWDLVKGSVNGNILKIESSNPNSTSTISWLVIGERKDKHMYDTDWTDENGKVIVEPIKQREI